MSAAAPETIDASPHRFWLVWSPSGSNPKRWHASESAANAEAKRLAISAPGSEFFVLCASDMYVAAGLKHTILTEDDMPF